MKWLYRAQNNGRSTDNVRPKIVFVRPNLAMTGHDVRSLVSLLVLYIACYHTAETNFQPFLSHWQRKYVFFSNCSSRRVYDVRPKIRDVRPKIRLTGHDVRRKFLRYFVPCYIQLSIQSNDYVQLTIYIVIWLYTIKYIVKWLCTIDCVHSQMTIYD